MLSIGGVASASAANHRHRHTGGSVTGRHPKHPGHGGVNHHRGGAPSIMRSSWGKVGGTDVALYTLKNGAMKVAITNYGGVVQSIWVPDRRGRLVNVALGFPRLSDYVADFTQGATQSPWPESGGSGDTFFGAIIGRYANRIADHSFTLNGNPYTLDANNGKNTLHGGYLGWNTVVWKASPSSSADAATLTLTHDFPAGEGCLPSLSPGCTGFPATISATVTYSLTRAGQLTVGYDAKNTSTTDHSTGATASSS